MTSLDSSRREQTRIRRALRRRRRLGFGAATAAGSLAVLGISGTVLGTAGGTMRAAAGIQLVNLAGPLVANDAAGSGEAAKDEASNDAAAEAARPEDGRGGDIAPDPAAGGAATNAPGPEPEAGAEGELSVMAMPTAEEEQRKAAAEAQAQQAAQEAAARAAVPVDDPAAAKAYAASALPARGWDASQLTCLDKLWTKESEWLTSAVNPSSGAYGIAQSLPAGKMALSGDDWNVNYQTQINWGLEYISSRYGTPCSALTFHYANNWY
ncbi:MULTISPECIES: hypothetical protein [unclassified Arthrobacter]|uniref:aggregation-promoting factor C-terminal-like domain-containing protein n=1 Tax=unclassified Arthrobacter TaxID=235627 RepID=UPI0024DFFB04|nr:MULTISPECIES: hypothetical protein [unclassified Arthrobacter]MCC9146298.1 hypothetical protein [Arthrobacter sp. zg-Y919]MDK1277528.1 hypothetical protein [Arthrobacter sp. zg.Y919]WIB04012.1 hypothetical protein QNO10_04950 [Arthrobacter sp. zg-Y919]